MVLCRIVRIFTERLINMILTRKDLKEYLKMDAVACGRKTTRAKFYGDDVWKYTIALRKWEYYHNLTGAKKMILMPLRVLSHMRYHHMCVKLCTQVSINVFDKGLSIAHYGNICVHTNARVGKNCRIHHGVTIGSNWDDGAAIIGDNVFIGAGAKIIGKVKIADDVLIGANAVVIKDILESGTTWGGVPARKISDNSSRNFLKKELFE